jgi:hypothetical protein
MKLLLKWKLFVERNPIQDSVEFHRGYFNPVECGSFWTKHIGEEIDDATK